VVALTQRLLLVPLDETRPDVVEPLSLAVLTGVALTEGIKFLYGQADAILKRRAERKRAERLGTPPPAEPIAVRTPEIVDGRLAPISVDVVAADELADELKELRHQLDDYAQGYETPRDGDPDVLLAASALRDAIEDIIGQRITFKGEKREPSGTPVVTGRISAKEIRGRATAVDVGEMRAGRVDASVDAGVIEAGGEATGARISKLGG
jgi:hypothetical protein